MAGDCVVVVMAGLDFGCIGDGWEDNGRSSIGAPLASSR